MYLVLVIVAIFSLLTGYLYWSLIGLKGEADRLVAERDSLMEEINRLRGDYRELSVTVERLRGEIEDYRMIVNLSKSSVLYSSTSLVVGAADREPIDFYVNYSGYIEVDFIASYDVAVAVVQEFRGQYIILYQDRLVSEGVFFYPVLPGNFTVLFINVNPFDVRIHVNITHFY